MTVHHLRRQLLIVAVKLADLANMAVSFTAAALVVLQPDGRTVRQLLDMRFSLENTAAFLVLLLGWHLLFASFGLYRSRRMSSWSSLVRDVIRATTSGTILVALGGVAFGIQFTGPAFLAAFFAMTTAVGLATRLALRSLLGWVRGHGRNLRMALVVGTSPHAVRFARDLESRRELGYRIIGFADDDWPGLAEFEARGTSRVTTLEGIPAFLRDRVVDEVVITIPIRRFHEQVTHVIHACEEQGITVRLVSDLLFDLNLAHSKTEQFLGETVLTLATGAMAGWPVLIKRCLDAALSIVLLVALSPLFIVVSLAIKLTSDGPVFFCQERVGFNKRRFKMIKFRTMIARAEEKLAELEHANEVDGPVFKMRHDPRITSVGRILRRTSLDELPQLLNVLFGDMSLVGPRPLPVRDYEGFDHDSQRRRLSVRPGMTGLWQVSGRSSLPFERWLELDMRYIDKWSLWLDLKILARTVPAVLRGTGAA